MAPRAWLVLALAVGASACATILGNDFEITTKGDAGMSPEIDPDASKNVDAGAGMTKGGMGDEGGDAADDAPIDGPVCSPNEYRCKEAVLELCNTDRSGWAASATCISAALCDATSGKCLTPVCEPGDHKCDGADLQVCDTGQSGWKFVSTCAGAPFCDANKGMCVDKACNQGDYQCAGKDLQVCTGDASGWMTTATCDSSTLCDPMGKKCNAPACAAGSHRCNGAEYQVCNAMLTGWEHVADCTNATLCDVAKGCVAPTCQPGAFRCDPAAPANLQKCNATQSGWDPSATCISAAYCNASKGMCDAAPCQIGTFQCSGTELQKCKMDQTGWEPSNTCVTGALCDANNGVCNPPACAPTDHTCSNGVLYNCNAGRTGLVAGPTCQSQALCDAANGRCNVCIPNQFTCMGADLYQCSANGQMNNQIMTCSSALACNPTLGACSQCPATGRGPTMVNTGNFCIDSTEVTNAQYQAFLNSNPTNTPLPHPRCGFNSSFNPAMPLGAANLPVIYVDWCDAYTFCKWAGKRLCGQIGGTSNPPSLYNDATKSQWYQACTSNNPPVNIWPYGMTFNDNTCNGFNYPSGGMIGVGSAVACHGPSAPYDAIVDMSGNADEWEDSCTNAGPTDGHSDACRTRGGSAYDGGDPPSSGLNTPYFLSCGADWDGNLRNARTRAVGFRCCAP